MKILVDKALRTLKKMPKIIKSIKKTENDEKKSNFNLGRNPLEIVHGPFLNLLDYFFVLCIKGTFRYTKALPST